MPQNRFFNKSYLRNADKLKHKEYDDIRITSYETGFYVRPDRQTGVAISLGFGAILARHLRDVNRLFTWPEAEEILDEVCLDHVKNNDPYKVARKIQKRNSR